MFSQPSSYIPHRLKFKDINEANPTKANDHGVKKFSSAKKKNSYCLEDAFNSYNSIQEIKRLQNVQEY